MIIIRYIAATAKAVLFSVLCVFFSGVFAITSGAFYASSPCTVTCEQQNGFFFIASDGSADGYAVRYLDAAASGAPLAFSYAAAADDTDPASLLFDGQADIAVIKKSGHDSQISDNLLFSVRPVSVTSCAIYVKRDNRDVYYNDFAHMNGKNVGILNEPDYISFFGEYCKSNRFTANLVPCETAAELEAQLDSGALDMIVLDMFNYNSSLKCVGRFTAEPYYLAVSAEKSNLMSSLNTLLSKAYSENPYFASDITEEYFDTKNISSTPMFTYEEAMYIEEHGKITVGMKTDSKPVSYIDEAGNYAGMYVDIVNLISARSGIQMEITVVDSSISFGKLISEGSCDFIAGISKSNYTRTDGMFFTDPFVSDSFTMVSRKGSGFTSAVKNRVIVSKAMENFSKFFKDKYPENDIIVGGSDEQCLEAVRDGEADLFVQNSYVLNYLLQNPHYENLEIYPSFSLPSDICMMTDSSNIPIATIINKTIATLSKSDIELIIAKNTGSVYIPTVHDNLYKYRFELLTTLIFLTILVSALIIILSTAYKRFRIVNEKNSELMKLAEHSAHSAVEKREFLESLSHKIRSSLSVIVNSAALASKCTSNQARTEGYITKISVSANNLAEAVGDILTFSDTDLMNVSLSNEIFNFAQLRDRMKKNFSELCGSMGMKFSMSCNVNGESYSGDSEKAYRALGNVLTHAMRIIPKGSNVRVAVLGRGPEDGREFVSFKVSFSGPAVTEEIIRNVSRCVYNEFEFISAKDLIELMHGAALFSAEKDSFSFSAEIPFDVASKGPIRKKHIDSLRVIVVDSDNSVLDSAAAIFGSMRIGYDCITSCDDLLYTLRDSKEAGEPYTICILGANMCAGEYDDITERIYSACGSNVEVVIAKKKNEPLPDKFMDNVSVISKPIDRGELFMLMMSFGNIGGSLASNENLKVEYGLSGLNVLVADDTEFSRDIAVELLNIVGVNVETAVNGKEAVEKFRNSRDKYFDIILMDVQMPVCDGYQASSAIRKLSRSDASSVPIIAMTANAFSEDIAQTYISGMNDHIIKPVNTEMLYGKLRKYTGKGQL